MSYVSLSTTAHLTPSDPVPLCVDLDGTLIHTDLLYESFLQAIKKKPLLLILLPLWYFRHGLAYIKSVLLAYCDIEVDALPYNFPLINYLKARKAAGRKLILVTGSHQTLADKVATHLNLFDAVYGTTTINITGARKADFLVQKFGAHQFDYIGNEEKDRFIWQVSRRALITSASPYVEESLKEQVIFDTVFPPSFLSLGHIFKAIRIHQWAKNALVFVPVVTAHQLFHFKSVGLSVLAFLAFSFCASATYIINDALDLAADRKHRTKRFRPFASGKVSLQQGFMLILLLAFATLLICTQMPALFNVALITYTVVTLLYSFLLKQIASLDILCLASLYTIRVIAGAFAIEVALSFWLLAFSMFLFLCLGIVKRVSELKNLEKTNTQKARGRGYTISDIQVLKSLGAASGYIAVLVFALYINSNLTHSLYQSPTILWLLCPLLLYWVTRIWMLTARSEMDEDPIVFAITDKTSWVIVFLSTILLVLAKYV